MHDSLRLMITVINLHSIFSCISRPRPFRHHWPIMLNSVVSSAHTTVPSSWAHHVRHHGRLASQLLYLSCIHCYAPGRLLSRERTCISPAPVLRPCPRIRHFALSPNARPSSQTRAGDGSSPIGGCTDCQGSPTTSFGMMSALAAGSSNDSESIWKLAMDTPHDCGHAVLTKPPLENEYEQ